MSIKIGEYTFEGPYTTIDDLEDRSGIYAILDRRSDGYHVIDIGEAGGVKSRVETHDRRGCWQRSSSGTLSVSLLYTPHLQQPGRREIEQDIRGQFAPPCGER